MPTDVDIFLMGTAGQYNDPNRSLWREPLKKIAADLGLVAFDPVKPDWTEADSQIEADAMASAEILVVNITTVTTGVASLVETGFSVAELLWSILQNEPRKQICFLIDMYASNTRETDDSRRGRTVARTYLAKWMDRLPKDIYLAKDAEDLARWLREQGETLVASRRPLTVAERIERLLHS